MIQISGPGYPCNTRSCDEEGVCFDDNGNWVCTECHQEWLLYGGAGEEEVILDDEELDDDE